MSAMIPANSVHLISGGNVIKQGDETPLTFQLNDESGQPVDLAGATVTVRMANSQIVVLTKQVTVNDDNTVSFAITSDEATGHGEMRLEFVVNKEGKQEIFPAQGFQQITIQPSLGGLDSGYVAVITIEEFERRVNEAVNRADTATDGAIEAMNAANTAAQNVSTAMESANQAADKANQAAQNATAEASNLSQLKTDVSAATDEANSAATSATQAATNANTAAQNATTQANYAKQQGDYAKQQGDIAKGIIESGTVTSVNGQKGDVVLGAEDVNAIPATEKGVAGGVAKLNEDGKVVDASGNEVDGKVKSVNGQTGEVNIIIPTKTSELINDSDFVTSQFVTEKVGEVSNELASQLAQNTKKIRNVITPEEFGAVGDGVTDDILAFEQAHDYAYENNATLLLSNKTYGISRTFFVKDFIEIEGLTNTTILALSGFVGDSVIKSYDYDNQNIEFLSISNINVNGGWQNVYGVRVKLKQFSYSSLRIFNCLLGGLNTDQNTAQPILNKYTYTDDFPGYNYYTSSGERYGKLETFCCGGTSVYWNHMHDTWLGDIECLGIDYLRKSDGVRLPGADETMISDCAIHIGPQAQCEIGKVHVYGFKDCMKVEARITADLLILESYFDSALIMYPESVNSHITRIEVFQNLTPTGNFTGNREGRNDVPVVHINAHGNVRIDDLYIRQHWADPEKINDTSASSNPEYATILANRETKKCLVIDSDYTHIGNLVIEGKQRGDINLQKYYPVGVEINGNHNKINAGQINFCSIGLISKSGDTQSNEINLNFFYTRKGWKNIVGTGTYGGNKYNLNYTHVTTHDGKGSTSLFHSEWQDINLDRGERMKYYWSLGDGNYFMYPSVVKRTYDLSAVINNQKVFLSNKTGKVTKPEEIDIQIMTTGDVSAVKNCSALLTNHTLWGSDFYFDNTVATPGVTATVIIRIGLT